MSGSEPLLQNSRGLSPTEPNATSSSWINLVERLFAEITRQTIRRGVFKSVADLEAAIEISLAQRNAKPKPFKWTAKANIILEKNARVSNE
jgi:hypothetical protein